MWFHIQLLNLLSFGFFLVSFFFFLIIYLHKKMIMSWDSFDLPGYPFLICRQSSHNFWAQHPNNCMLRRIYLDSVFPMANHLTLKYNQTFCSNLICPPFPIVHLTGHWWWSPANSIAAGTVTKQQFQASTLGTCT